MAKVITALLAASNAYAWRQVRTTTCKRLSYSTNNAFACTLITSVSKDRALYKLCVAKTKPLLSMCDPKRFVRLTPLPLCLFWVGRATAISPALYVRLN